MQHSESINTLRAEGARQESGYRNPETMTYKEGYLTEAVAIERGKESGE